MKYLIVQLFSLILMPSLGFSQEEGKTMASYEYSEIQKKFNSELSKKNDIEFKVNFENLTEFELINHSKETRIILTQDGSLLVIAEAFKDKKWTPIQFWVWSDCGNSFDFPLELKPNEFVKVEIPNFSGNLKVSLRLKIYTGNECLYSENFDGYINEKMLEELIIPKNKEYYYSGDIFLQKCEIEIEEKTIRPDEIYDQPIKNK